MRQEAVVFAAIFAAFVLFVAVSWKNRQGSWSLSTFFMGGRNIGAPLTEHTFWGTSFSFANGIYYFTALGYFNGLAVIWLQIPWILSIGFLIWKLPLLVSVTEKFTLHGFIGSKFGRLSAVAASFVTIVGFLGAVAFEINVSSEIIASAMNIPNVVVPLTIVAAITAAAYTDTGGFLGAARINRLQNLMGLGAVVVLVLLVYDFRLGQDIDSTSGASLTASGVFYALFDFSNFDIVATVGILCFAFTTNIVDMSNWQTIAANSAADVSQVRKLRWAMARSGIWIFFVPAVAGSFLGYGFRGLTTGGEAFSDTQILPALIGSLTGTAVGTALLALVCVGLIAAALSTVDSYLLSTAQTVSWDLRLEAEKAQDLKDESRQDFERLAVRRARNELYLYAAVACGIFVWLRYLIDNDQTVFVLQFAIFGMITAIFPATILAVWCQEKVCLPATAGKRIVTGSILLGIAANTIVIYLAIRAEGSFNAYAMAPIVTLLSSSVVGVLGYFVLRRANGKRAGESDGDQPVG